MNSSASMDTTQGSNCSGSSIMESFLQEAQQQTNDQPIPEPPEVTPPAVAQNPHAGFDPHAGTNWLYPIDYTSSDYLPLIAEKCLYHNSLVILPNKTEKTFITAITMYNIYRWYPLGKVIYVAPKRPLIDDQKFACEQYMKFLPTDVVDMQMKPHDRTRMWMAKRVFFISSTMMLMDINRAAPDIPQVMDKVKLIVIDDPQLEHRVHTKIIQKFLEFTKNFRVLCVSMTSGKTVEASLLKTWLISNIELQWGNPHETPEDWLMNKKEISNIWTPLGLSLLALLEEFKQVARPFLQKLVTAKLFSCGTDFDHITVENVQRERARYEQGILTGIMRKDHHDVMMNFHVTQRLLEAYHILEREGIVAVLEYFHRANDILVQADQNMVAFLNKLRSGVYNTPHPKFRTLENFLKEFYQRRNDANILIVVERLDAAVVILQILRQVPESKPKMIVDSNFAHDVQQFRNGEYNTLIVTIEVEPVLVLGKVDLIVLFNMTSHPREFLAHIARTRGADPGAIVTFTTEGAEQLEITDIINTRRLYYFENRNILPIGVDLSNKMMQCSPGLIPPGFQPKGRKIFFNIPTVSVAAAPQDQPGTSSGSSNGCNGTKVEPISPASSPGVGASQKRKIVEVLADVPATYDVTNGQTYYEVISLKQQQLEVPLSPGPAFMPT
ncbi:Fanconi anemia group M protein-like [Armigeres subalbatus]|uniref:Fanconi anemia group M protein-like n=1 Tax=Armigeres subalbatus TaxID=124917 RepID=UPI002ED136E7